MKLGFAIAAFFVLAAAPAVADDALERALASDRAEHPHSHAFDWRLVRDGGPEAVLRHDPRLDAPWTLIRIDGRAPSAEDVAAFAADESPTLHPVVGYHAVRGLIAEPEFVAAEGTARHYRFRPDPSAAPSRQEAMLYDHLEGEIVVRLTGESPWIETVRIHAPAAFRPAPPAKIDVYERRFDFVAWNPFTEGPALKRFTARTKGRVFFDMFERQAVAEVELLGPVERAPGAVSRPASLVEPGRTR